MKITAIKQQINRTGRYSIFIDGQYVFSLSDVALLESKLVVGQELSEKQAEQCKQLGANDGLYDQALRYAVLRPRSYWEMSIYLQRKNASPALAENILNRLSNIDLVNDRKFAEAYIEDRQRLRPTSRRKIIMGLHQKHVAEEVIQTVLGSEAEPEQTALLAIIKSKRKQSRYQDDMKLMQYLSRQGFSYGDIKAALKAAGESNHI